MEYHNVKLIHIDWTGPYLLTNITDLMDEEIDYGIYQIYGKHPVYGSNVLLYIGKADFQTLGKRISQENWWDTNDSSTIMIYAGRLAGECTPEESNWSKEIDMAEKLLIYVHKPAYNSKNLSNIPEMDLKDVHILNWGSYRALLPEVSGLRWTSKLDSIEHGIYRVD
ncbi:hypothetical protein I2483_12715 [Sporosarcina sp. E16_3]|uniref:hypothetical protein n=1 Tax=Sporosarcina sp. E16_3 TaxID=2789293 RepID=UPI001A926A7E|nr:hypothetical protein [Sporosarcina sp. E16_3]MBO0602521.1 hypothetical protein [Sporosarcina sp. E16_3]